MQSAPLFLLFLLFLGLKLGGVIAWSWLWVTAPLWLGFAFIAAFMLLVFLGFGLAALGAKVRVRHRGF